MPRHWHTIENTPGYMPDDDPGCYSSRREAVADALHLVERLREQAYRVRGSGRIGQWFGTDGRQYDLGRVITISDVSSYGLECDPRNPEW